MLQETKAPLSILLAVFAVFLVALPAGAASVVPVVVPGNPDCAGQGFSFGFKPQPEPPPTGVYTFPDGVNTLTITSDGTYFSFSSTLALDAVIVKGSSSANYYAYPSEVTADSGLHAPVNSSGDLAAISHIEVCYDYEVTVAKTAVLTYEKLIDWTIAKSVTPARIDLFTGDGGTASYTVTVTKNETFTDFRVSGEIVITNPAPAPNVATILAVTDVLSDGTSAIVACPGTSIEPGGTMTCTYSADLSGLPAAALTNTVTVTTTGVVGGGADEEPVIVAPPTVTGEPEIVDVTDTNGMTWPGLTTGGVFTYNRPFTCNGDAGNHDNTATIEGTGDSASATVEVHCWSLGVQVTGAMTLERDYDWTITKSANPEGLTLSTGQVGLVNYSVVLGAEPTDRNIEAHGTIVITNPSPLNVEVNVADALSDGSTVNVDCPTTTLPGGEQMTCPWTAAPPAAANLTNTVTVTLTGHAGSYSDSVDIVPVVSEFDECVTLSDTYPGAGLPEDLVCYDGILSYAYTRSFTYLACSETDIVEGNTASFATAEETPETGSDDATVVIKVPCGTGCTLTPGYWKTHSNYGPAPYDDTWALDPAVGEDVPFFSSEKTYYQVLWTAPVGNPYYILAHAWIATRLNILNGASVPEYVQDAFDNAEAIFSDPVNTPAYIAEMKGRSATQLRAEMLGYAYDLDQYNNGLAAGGPPHCSE